MKTFKELGLSPEFVSELEKSKITIPSEIQEKAIPIVLAGKDVIGGSATGSGKTLVFASSIVENLKKNGSIQSLILTPTRELAEQVSKSIANFSKHKKLKVLAIYGGVSIYNQIKLLKKADVVVGTPGRILDHLSRKTINFDEVKFLILDEVDRMFDMGFKVDVEKILKTCPEKRQTMFFSATIDNDNNSLAQKHTKNPEKISVKSHIDASKLKQIYYDVDNKFKFSLFVHLLKEEKSKLVMVFCSTRRNVDFVTNNLGKLGIHAQAIHGGLNQNKRKRVLEEFNKEGGTNVLVCTDVAARGLDIPKVSHVYNYDLPKESTDYIHRIGRTARAGKNGIAINILCSRDYENFSNILKNKKIKIEEIKIPEFEKVRVALNRESTRNFGRRSGRDSRDRRPRREGEDRRPRRDSRDRNSRPDNRRPRTMGNNRRPRQDGWGNKRPTQNSRDRRPRREGEDRRPRREGEDRRPRRDSRDRNSRPDNRRPRTMSNNRQPQQDGWGNKRPTQNSRDRRPRREGEDRRPRREGEDRRPRRDSRDRNSKQDNRRPKRNSWNNRADNKKPRQNRR